MVLVISGAASAHDTGDTVSMDGQYPTIEIDSPKHNESVGHIVHITGHANYTPNQTAIKKVVLTINNTDYEINDATNGWQYDWNTSNFPNGQYSIRATVFALNNKTGTPRNLTAAQTILVNLNNCYNTQTMAFNSQGTINDQIWLNALLQDKNNNPLTGKTVQFFVNNLVVGNGTTNNNGMVFCKYTPISNGVFNVRAKFDGDESYNSSEGASLLTVVDNLPSTTLNYSTYFGGSSHEKGRGFVVDNEGNIYFAGNTKSANAVPNDFPTNSTIIRFGTGGGNDVYVAKMNKAGQLLWNAIIGGNGTDSANSIDLDMEGNVYVIGNTASNDFPTTEGAFDRVYGNVTDAFILKINATGKNLIYSTYLGGTILTRGWAIDVDNQGNAYVTGITNSPDFPTTPGAFQTTKKGPLWNTSQPADQTFQDSFDGFVAKLNQNGSALIYSTYIGGSQADQPQDIKVDKNGCAYIIGEETVSTDFPTTPNAFQPHYNGGTQDSFVTKFNPTGSALIYSTYLGGSGYEAARAMALDENECVYVVGYTTSNNFPISSKAYQKTNKGIGATNYDGFITKLNKNGTAMYYSTFLGGSGLDVIWNIAINKEGYAYLTGQTSSQDFPVTPDAYQKLNAGSDDVFITKLSPNGGNITYSTYLGGSSAINGPGVPATVKPDDHGWAVVLADGGFYVYGETQSSNFPVTANAFQNQTGYKGNTTGTPGDGVWDVFITHFNNPTQLDTSKVTYKNNTLSFKTTLTSNYSPISGKTVKFMVNGKVVGTGITNSKGVASFNYKISARAGNYTVATQFNKTNEYTGSSSNYKKFAVSKYKYTVKVRYKVKYKQKYKKWHKVHGKWRSYTTYKWKTKWKTKKITKTTLRGVNL